MIAGSRDASWFGRPHRVEFRRDGTFTADFALNPVKDRSHIGEPMPRGLVGGTWRASVGFLCGIKVETEPGLPNIIEIVAGPDRLTMIGSGAGMYDVEYRRAVVVPDTP